MLFYVDEQEQPVYYNKRSRWRTKGDENMTLDLMRLRAERVAKGLTQEQLAHKLGMTRTAYAKRENGIVDVGADELAQITEALGLTKNDIPIFFKNIVPKKERNK